MQCKEEASSRLRRTEEYVEGAAQLLTPQCAKSSLAKVGFAQL